jgi:hypothetical protein
MLLQRDPLKIRADALSMGVKKARAGCLDCMEGYFRIARQHGATEEDIQSALEVVTGSVGNRLGRRDLMKAALASGLAVASLGSLADTVHADTVPYYWGTDSNTSNCCGMPMNFYIGRMGYGVEPNGDPYFFNVNMANQVGVNRTFGYWGLQGPGLKPAGTTAFDWGVRQADAAWHAWHTSGSRRNRLAMGGPCVRCCGGKGGQPWGHHKRSRYGS